MRKIQAPKDSEDSAVTAREVEQVKRLLILLLVKLGTSSEEIAHVMNVDASVVRRIAPSRRIKKLSLGDMKE